jgi:broad specificity phosphatase PhoE
MKLVLIRHGETTWNVMGKCQGQADPPLTLEGIQQAKVFADQLKTTIHDFSAIYSSQLSRAKVTAEIIGEGTQIPIILDRRLNSRNLGDFSGMTLGEIKAYQPKEFKRWISGDPTFRPPNGESTAELMDFTKSFLQEIQQKYPKTAKLLIIAHRENIAAFTVAITGKQPKDNPLQSIKNCTPYEFSI